ADRVGKGIRGAPRDALLADAAPPAVRGRAFGLHRAADHLGAVLGPRGAFVMMERLGMPLRAIFLWAAVPGVLAVLAVVFGVRERRGAATARSEARPDPLPRRPAPDARSGEARTPLGAPFWRYLAVLLLFTLGNATDAFLLLRASSLGVPTAAIPLLWAALHVVKSSSSVAGGSLSDHLGRKPLIVAGWALYALVYLLFALATEAWHAWALFLLYGAYFGLTEGVERALVADLAPATRRGTAFGWYNLAIGLGALPASVIFGVVWDAVSPEAAFLLGAALALGAAVGLVALVPARANA
ncbi:MAG TPA: MFS transporter, partial [Gemmatimonadaceae bacterium]|nr:MFS transporter [Gemmatimonadaceae bacterium]